MSKTPYSPPAARVDDPQEPPHSRPTSVDYAVACLWISVALTVALTASALAGLITTGQVLQDAVTNTLGAALTALIASKLNAGRNWARWLLVVLYALGSCVLIVAVLLAPQALLPLPPILIASGVAQFALQGAALAFVLSRSSRQWFSTIGTSLRVLQEVKTGT